MAEVFVHWRPVGTLSRDEPAHRFTYGVGVPESLAVSLLMPVDASSYPAERLTVQSLTRQAVPDGTCSQSPLYLVGL